MEEEGQLEKERYVVGGGGEEGGGGVVGGGRSSLSLSRPCQYKSGTMKNFLMLNKTFCFYLFCFSNNIYSSVDFGSLFYICASRIRFCYILYGQF